MARLIYSATTSLDGYLAGPGGDMSRLTEHLGTPDPAAERLLPLVGAVLAGRRTHDGDHPNAGPTRRAPSAGGTTGPRSS